VESAVKEENKQVFSKSKAADGHIERIKLASAGVVSNADH
jgi:hypothetical protein